MNPEIEKKIVHLIHEEECLCLTYADAQVRFLTEELCLPGMSRLFELIERLERERLAEIRRFQVSRGAKVIVTDDIKPINIASSKPVEILKAILGQERNILNIVIQLSKMSVDKADMELVAFIESRVILRMRKVIFKREQQIRSFERRTDDLTSMLVEEMFVNWQVTRLEKQLTFELGRRNWTESSHNLRVTDIDRRINTWKISGQSTRF